MYKKLFLFLYFAHHLAFAFTPAELSAQLRAPANIQGEFLQQRHLRNLDKPLQSQGKFVLLPGELLLWQMQSPFALNIRVRADGIAQQDGNGEWQQSGQSGQSMQIRLFMALLGGDTGALEKQFTLTLSGEAADWQLQLLPKSALMQQIFTRITIRGDAFVREVELAETQGERTVLQFSHLRDNAALPPLASESLR